MGVPTDIPMPVSMVDTEPMVPTPLPTDMDTEPMVPTPTLTMERGLLMLSPRLMLRLTLPSSMVPMDIPMPVSMGDTEPMVPTQLPMDMDTEPMVPTPILTTARGPLMLSPRLMLRLTPPSSMVPTDIPMLVSTPLPTDMDTEPMEPTPILTTERGLLMLSPRLMLRLTPLSSTDPTDIPMPVSMVDTEPMVPTPLPTDMDTEPMEPTPTLTMERGLLMLSPRLTPLSSTPPPMLSPP